MSDTETEPTTDPAESTTEVPEWLSLEEGERIEWQGEPSTMSLAGQAIMGVVLVVVLVGILILLTLPLSYLGIKNTDYVVTNRALYVKSGIASTNIESVSLDRIQNTEFSQGFVGKQFGLGNIAISTAGSGGQDLSFDNIEEAREVRQLINRLSSEYESGGDGVATEASGAATERMETLITELRETRKALQTIADNVETVEPATGETDNAAERESDTDR